ncbi:ECF transporter S component [Actinotalea fermentans]|uniref:Uncharacterized protein n=1 Tax=Actinotalea fermentans TaxID=43671 RepID=A0A511YUQ7_9CELL|nr:ECF transporter S component [Actinotalea fermentans]GEN78934.1 hypothetical protein AFE02nite_06680 [Actinotalea fermentans]
MSAPGSGTPSRTSLRAGARTGVALTLASLVGLVAFAWPLVAAPGAALAQADTAPAALAAVLVVVLGVVTVALDDGRMDAKAVAVLGLLAAVGSVLRPVSAGTAGVELVFLTIVLGGRVLGPAFGFALGSTTLAASALLTGGVGPWLPFQMLGASWVGMGAGLLPRRLGGRAEVVAVAAYGAGAAAAFGVAMNLSFWPFQLGAGTGLSFVAGDAVGANLHRFWLYWLATSLGWDVGRAATTAIGLLLLGGPALRALRRTAARARFAPSAGPAPTRSAAGTAVGTARGSVAPDASGALPGDTPELSEATRRSPG